jgi:hypothetical protein
VDSENRAVPVETKPFQFSIRAMLIVIAVVGVSLGLFASAVRSARDAAFTSVCHGRLCGLALALHNYHDVYGTFPPATVAGPDGKPWHSWRTLLLPFIEQRSLYEEYRFDEPWNGPTNRTLLSTAPAAFRCSVDRGPVTNTSYVAVTGPGTMWPDGRGMSLTEIGDGSENTIMIVEMAVSGIPWMEPRDLRIDDMAFQVNGELGKSISSRHFTGAVVAFADGHRELLGPETTEAAIRRMLLIEDEHTSNARPKAPDELREPAPSTGR